MSKEFVDPYYFDCRHFIVPGDMVSIDRDKDNNEFIGDYVEVDKVYERFISLKTKAHYMCNRWNIQSVNGHKVTAGCLINCPTLKERGLA